MDSTEKKPLNKFAKMTMWASIAAVLLNLFTSLIASLPPLVLYDPVSNPNYWDSLEIVFYLSFYASIALMFLVVIFGAIALVQTRKRRERGGVVALLLAVASIVYMIFKFLI